MENLRQMLKAARQRIRIFNGSFVCGEFPGIVFVAFVACSCSLIVKNSSCVHC